MFGKEFAVAFLMLAATANAFAGKNPYTVDLASENLPNLVSIYGAMNSMCRDKPDAVQECARRDVAAAEMQSRGWCWGPENAVGSDKEWVKCAATAQAASIPHFDAKAHCERVANSSGARSEMIFGGCMSQEQSSYNDVKSVWSTLPASMQSHCSRVAASGGIGSYMILSGCIQQEVQAKKNNAGTEFRY